MSKIIKRLLIFFAAAFAFLSVSVFVVLSEPLVQRSIVRYVNTHYLNEEGFNLTIGGFSYNLFLRTISIENAQFNNVGNTQELPPILVVKTLTAKVNLITSYLNNRVLIDTLSIDGAKITLNYDSNGDLILPKIFIKQGAIAETKTKSFILLDKYIDDIPKKILILDTNIQIGQKDQDEYHDLYIKEIKIGKPKKRFGSKHQLEISTVIKNSRVFFKWFHKPINISSLRIDGILHRNGKLDISNFLLTSDLLNLESKIYAFLQDPVLLSPYEIDFKKIDILAEDFFNVLNLPSKGKMQITGKLKSVAISEEPQFLGEVQWQNVILEDFNLFSGHSLIQFKNKTLYYDKAALKMPLGGQVFAHGKYEFYDDFYFENYGIVQQLSLKELLDGVHAKQNIFDAFLQSKNVAVLGHLKKEITQSQKDKYDILISAGVDVQNLTVIPIQDQKRKSLPELFVDLNIKINDSGLFFDQSSAHFFNRTKNQEGLIEVSNSSLLLKNKPTFSMDLSGKNLDLSFLEYFITKKSSGILNFSGILTYNDQNPGLKFQSKIEAQNGTIDSIPFLKAAGNFFLFEESGELSDLVFEVAQKKTVKNTSTVTAAVTSQNQPAQNTNFNVQYFSFRYADMYSHIIANAQGNLADFFNALKNKVPKIFGTFDGNIQTFNFTMSGYILHPDTWKVNFDLNIQPLITQKGTLNAVLMHFDCVSGECTQSKVLLDGFEEKPDSSALILFYDVSNKKSNFTFQIQNVPIDFFNYTPTKITGSLYGTGELQGTWQKPIGDIDLNIDHAAINDREIGPVYARYNAVNPKTAQFQMLAFDNQIALSVRIPIDNTDQNSNINITFSNFDIARVFPQNSSLVSAIYSQINAQIELSGKWNPDLKTGFSFLKQWSGSGLINQSDLQLGYANLTLYSPNKILFKNNKIYADNLTISSDFISTKINGYYDPLTTQIALDSIVKMDLSNLHKNFYVITESEGTLNSEIHITGTSANPTISGYLALAADKVTIRSDPTSYTDIEGYVTIHNTIIQIQKFNAKKGIGNLSLTGTADFQNNNSFGYPKTNLHLLTRNMAFQFPVPIFRTVDMVLNSDLTVSGQKPPFLITGRVEIQKLSLFRDLTCPEIYAEYKNLPKVDTNVRSSEFADLNVNIQAFNSISIQSNCLRGRFSTTENMRVIGNTDAPLLDGGIQTENSIFSILKARFNVKNASFIFSEKYKFDPIANISMNTRIASYDIYWDVNGRVTDAKLNLTAEPEYLPDGSVIGDSAILFMITTGQIPTPDSVNTLLTTSSGVYSYFGTNNSFSSVLDQTLVTVTGGIFDTLSVSPINVNGEVGVGFIASRNFSQRLTFGLGFEGTESQSVSSVFFYYLLNKHVNFTAEYQRSILNSNTAAINDIGAGLRFNFGSY